MTEVTMMRMMNFMVLVYRFWFKVSSSSLINCKVDISVF